MRKTPSEAYLEKARHLSKEETERLLSRMREKLTRRLEDKKLSALEVVAIQLEIEDEALSEWRERMQEIRKKQSPNNSFIVQPWPAPILVPHLHRHSRRMRRGPASMRRQFHAVHHSGSRRDQPISTGTESTLVYSP
ncbi:hypothetical protein [Thiobacillus sp.]|uniref:hypothetical protein n=1 Tax=Thiobacillus sp. TaxID=924 RepID=UPI0025E16581|nr:hypothetical protein [Thiobacillus sp.]